MIHFQSILLCALAALVARGAAQQCSCPPEMTNAGGVCIDKWEAAVEGHSPFDVLSGRHTKRAVSAAGQTPQGYISGEAAAAACANVGKRLCTEPEWERACKGPSGTTFPYGNTYDSARCNEGRAHPIPRVFSTPRYDHTQLNDRRLNQLSGGLAPTGQYAQCVTAEGAFDMHGNLHEWVSTPGGIFRGGFYVDGYRNGQGCNYRTRLHDIYHHDYSTGFRCCRNLCGNSQSPPNVPAEPVDPQRSFGRCTGLAGDCLDRSVATCATGAFVSLKCPGLPNSVVCCPDGATDGGGPVEPVEPVKPEPPVNGNFGRCTGVAGNCLDSSATTCATAGGFVTRKCPAHGNSILCCPDAAPTNNASPTPTNYGRCTGLAGDCLDRRQTQCATPGGFVRFKCPGLAADIVCCPDQADGRPNFAPLAMAATDAPVTDAPSAGAASVVSALVAAGTIALAVL